MGEPLFRKWIEEEELNLAEALPLIGIEGILREFEFWLERKKILKLCGGE